MSTTPSAAAPAAPKLKSFHHEHPSYRWWVLANVLITTFMSVLESTVVNTALPSMQNAFGTSLDVIEWVLTAYQLVFAVVLPLSGWLSDKIGYKRNFLMSLILFTTGSFLCSFAWNETVLIIFRIVQGIGGGMIMPVGMAIVTREFPPEQRGVAMGFYGIAAAASISIGPSLGGVLVDNIGWSSIFLINVPVGILAIVATVVIQREVIRKDVGPFDTWGFVSIAVFLVSLLLALADGNAGWNTGGWTSPFILTCFTVSAISLVAFFAVELSIEHPIVNLRLFLNRNFGFSNLLLFLIGLVLSGATFLMPVYMQGTLGYTALQSGLLFLPQGIVQAVISPVTGVLTDKLGPKVPALAGLGVLVVSFFMNTMLTANPPFWLLMVPIVLRGAGFGLLFIAIQSVSVSALPVQQIAQGSGLSTLTRQIGTSFGVAIFGAIINYRNIFHAAVAGEDMNQYSEAFRATAAGLKFAITGNTGQVTVDANTITGMLISKEAQTQAFVNTINDSFWITTAVIAVCAIPVLLLQAKRRGGPKVAAPAHFD